jgi:hypothetical protein
MSLIEEDGGSPGVVIMRIVGYGLAAIGFLLPLLPARWGGQPIAALALAVPPLVFALLLAAPEAYGASFRRWGGRAAQRTVSPLLILAVLGLFLVAVSADVVDPSPAVLTAGLCAAICVLLGVGAARRPMPGGLVEAVIFLALFGAGYGYAAPIFANLRFDASPPQAFQAQVRSRYESHGRSGVSYTVVLEPFGPVKRSVRAGVRAGAYAALPPGATACVVLHGGALGMAWYAAGRCQ